MQIPTSADRPWQYAAGSIESGKAPCPMSSANVRQPTKANAQNAMHGTCRILRDWLTTCVLMRMWTKPKSNDPGLYKIPILTETLTFATCSWASPVAARGTQSA